VVWAQPPATVAPARNPSVAVSPNSRHPVLSLLQRRQRQRVELVEAEAQQAEAQQAEAQQVEAQQVEAQQVELQ